MHNTDASHKTPDAHTNRFGYFRETALADVIVMEHFGKVGWQYAHGAHFHPCRVRDEWADSCDMQLTDAIDRISPKKKLVPCYSPGKDLLVPAPIMEEPSTRYLNPRLAALPLNVTFFLHGANIHTADNLDKPEHGTGYRCASRCCLNALPLLLIRAWGGGGNNAAGFGVSCGE